MGDEITMRAYMVLTFAKCITTMIVQLMVKKGPGSSQD
jgi:hypothetical protein